MLCNVRRSQNLSNKYVVRNTLLSKCLRNRKPSGNHATKWVKRLDVRVISVVKDSGGNPYLIMSTAGFNPLNIRLIHK